MLVPRRLALGPRRAEVLLTWMLDNATALSQSAAPFAVDPLADEESGDESASGAARLEGAALEGLGALIGGGRMAADARERAFATLQARATARDNDRYLVGVAEGLARSSDPRAVELLEAIGTDAARALLKELAGGHAGAFRTQEAKRALERNRR